MLTRPNTIKAKAKATVPRSRPAYCKAKATKFGLKAKAKD